MAISGVFIIGLFLVYFGVVLAYIVDIHTNYAFHRYGSPKAYFAARREKKRLAVLEAEKARRADEIKLTVEYYAERKVRRRQANTEWLREFNALTDEEDARTPPQDFSVPYITSQRYMEMMWGIKSKKRRW